MSSDLTLLLGWILFYVVLARCLKIYSDVVQLHSVFHCTVASVWTGFAILRITNGGSLLTYDLYHPMQSVNDVDKSMLMMTAFHSAGYFIGDTIDICFDKINTKRRIYIFHHLVAVAGLLTIFWDSYICLLGLWTLEIGGIVHHIKHAAHVFKATAWMKNAAEVLYHVVYLLSRLYLLINTSYGFLCIRESKTIAIDLVCFAVVYILVAQNFIWWFQNFRKLFEENEKTV
jgi:hypothetical protein